MPLAPATRLGPYEIVAFAPASSFSPAIRFSMAPDGKSFVYSVATRHSNLWMFEGFQ
jgi:hypothetical protein